MTAFARLAHDPRMGRARELRLNLSYRAGYMVGFRRRTFFKFPWLDRTVFALAYMDGLTKRNLQEHRQDASSGREPAVTQDRARTSGL